MGSLASSLPELCSPTTRASPPYVGGRLATLANTIQPAAVRVQLALIVPTGRCVILADDDDLDHNPLLRTELLVELEHILNPVHLSAHSVRLAHSPIVSAL